MATDPMPCQSHDKHSILDELLKFYMLGAALEPYLKCGDQLLQENDAYPHHNGILDCTQDLQVHINCLPLTSNRRRMHQMVTRRHLRKWHQMTLSWLAHCMSCILQQVKTPLTDGSISMQCQPKEW